MDKDSKRELWKVIGAVLLAGLIVGYIGLSVLLSK